MSDLQEQINALTKLVNDQHKAHAQATAALKDMCEFLAARADLTSELLQALLGTTPEHVQTIAVAAAQLRGERLQEQGPPEISAAYQRLLAGIVANRR